LAKSLFRTGFVALLAAVVMALGLGRPSARAAGCHATLSVSPPAGAVGARVTITGRGFTADCWLGGGTGNGDGLIMQNAGDGATDGYAPVADPGSKPPIAADGSFSLAYTIPSVLFGYQGSRGGPVLPGPYAFHTQPPVAQASFTVTSAPPACRFVLGFQTLHDLLFWIVGPCLDDEQHNPANGDGLQRTINGLLVWRKADNVVAFTDGTRTWLNGPHGLEERLNSKRFAWEANPTGLPVVPDFVVSPGPYVSDEALGVALALPAGWQQNAPGKQPSHELDLVVPPAQPGAGDSSLRLVIGSWGTTTDPDAARAASAGMDRLLAGLGALPAPVMRTPVNYGGAPGVMVHGLPGGLSGPTTAIILAHDGALYKILAPGAALAPDQQYALESLVFIPRVGPFPPAD
jgi:hypothetical protein